MAEEEAEDKIEAVDGRALLGIEKAGLAPRTPRGKAR
jgi:hypothetical protein